MEKRHERARPPALVSRTLPSGLGPFDSDLGGLPRGSVVQAYGESAAGKTALALSVARANAPAALVLPERPHPERLSAILGAAARAMVVARPHDLDAQGRAVAAAARLLHDKRVRCVVVDSLTFLYRFERSASTEALQLLFGQLRLLHDAARTSGGIALFTNQVRGGPDGPRPVGGHAIGHISDVILALSVLDGPWRRLRLEKHPYAPSEGAWDLRLGSAGFE